MCRYLRTLFAEAAGVFSDGYLFLGGDEVSTACWASNANVTAWLKAQGMPTDASTLQACVHTCGNAARHDALRAQVTDVAVYRCVSSLVLLRCSSYSSML